MEKVIEKLKEAQVLAEETQPLSVANKINALVWKLEN